jgi:hypothetical protein
MGDNWKMRSSFVSGTGGRMLFATFLCGILLMFASMWRTNVKAGLPGWGALVPIYNCVLMLRMAGRPDWWLVLSCIPVANFLLICLPFDIAKRFGKHALFGLGLLVLPFVFYPILAFGKAQYRAPASRVPDHSP